MIDRIIDLAWNFPLLPRQQGLWAQYLTAAMQASAAEPVESQRPSFRTVELSLRQRAATLLGFPVERTWIILGGHHGNLNALLASGLAGTRIAMDAVTYPGFLDQCLMTKTAIDAIPIDAEGIIPSALREACLRARAQGHPIRGLFTMPTVQNPIGFVTPLHTRLAVVEIAREFDLIIIEDDAYGFMQHDAPANYAILAPERTFYVRGLAKSLAPGARTGFLIAPETATEALTMSLKGTATGTNVPQNMAAIAMMEDGTLDRLMVEKNTEGALRNREARTLLHGQAAPGAPNAWHLWIPLPSNFDLAALEQKITSADVMVTMGHWSAAAPAYANGMRLALGAEIDRATTLEGIRRIAEILHNGGGIASDRGAKSCSQLR